MEKLRKMFGKSFLYDFFYINKPENILLNTPKKYYFFYKLTRWNLILIQRESKRVKEIFKMSINIKKDYLKMLVNVKENIKTSKTIFEVNDFYIRFSFYTKKLTNWLFWITLVHKKTRISFCVLGLMFRQSYTAILKVSLV